jgi:hypothetical protein
MSSRLVYDTTPHCDWGWDPKGRHYSACCCNRLPGHPGRCKCDCGSTSQRPAEAKQEAS